MLPIKSRGNYLYCPYCNREFGNGISNVYADIVKMCDCEGMRKAVKIEKIEDKLKKGIVDSDTKELDMLPIKYKGNYAYCPYCGSEHGNGISIVWPETVWGCTCPGMLNAMKNKRLKEKIMKEKEPPKELKNIHRFNDFKNF
jgi:uncharacterized Zn-finger protein